MEQSEKVEMIYIEDDRRLRLVVSALAGEEGLNCIAPTNLDDLPALLETNNPRLVLLDGDISGLNHDRLRFGVDCLAVLEETNRLTRRQAILNQGRLNRDQLMAVMITGGLSDKGSRMRTREALLDGRLTGIILKPDMDPLCTLFEDLASGEIYEALSTLRKSTFNNQMFLMLGISSGEMENAWPEPFNEMMMLEAL